LEFCHLTVEVPSHEALALQLHTWQPGFDLALAVAAFGAAVEPMAG
jgi:hypothetical protein